MVHAAVQITRLSPAWCMVSAPGMMSVPGSLLLVCLSVLKAGASSEYCANTNSTLDPVMPCLSAQLYFRLCQLDKALVM